MLRLDGVAYYTGELVQLDQWHVRIKRATWHHNTGRHHEFMAGADSREREAYPPEQVLRLRAADCPLVMRWSGSLDAGSQ